MRTREHRRIPAEWGSISYWEEEKHAREGFFSCVNNEPSPGNPTSTEEEIQTMAAPPASHAQVPAQPPAAQVDPDERDARVLVALRRTMQTLKQRQPKDYRACRSFIAGLATGELGIAPSALLTPRGLAQAAQKLPQAQHAAVRRLLRKSLLVTGTVFWRTALDNHLSPRRKTAAPSPPVIKPDDPEGLRAYIAAGGRAVRKHAERVRNCLDFLESHGVRRSAMPSHADLLWLRRDLAARYPTTPQCADTVWRSYKAWLRFLKESGIVHDIPLLPGPIAYRTKRREWLVEDAEWQQRVSACRYTADPPFHLLLLILLQVTAARISDLLLLPRSAIDRRQESLLFRAEKNHRDVKIPLTALAMVILRHYLDTRPPIGPDERLLQQRGASLGYRVVWRQYRTALRRSGWEPPRGATYHVIRHTTATELMASTADLALVAEVLGITVRAAETYLHVSEDKKLEAWAAKAVSPLW